MTGARFGGYGSFLPAYQRSPSSLTHPRSQSHLTSRSPHNIPLEGSSLDSVQRNDYAPRRVSSSNYNAMQSLSIPGTDDVMQSPSVPGTDNAVHLLSVTKTISTDSLTKSRSSGEYVANKESRCPPRNGPILNPLKFRVKVVSDSVLPRDNSALYSGLGLDEDFPSEDDEASPNMREMADGSPSCIIEIMTSFPIPAGELISPLRGNLLHLVEYQGSLESSRPGPHQVVSLRQKGNNVEVVKIEKDNNEGQTDTARPFLMSGGTESLVKKEAVSKLSDLAGPMDKLSDSRHSFVSNGKDEVGYLEEVNDKSLKHRQGAKDKADGLGSDSFSHQEAVVKDKDGTTGAGRMVQKEKNSSAPRNDTILKEMNEDSSTDSVKSLRQQGLLQPHKREGVLDLVTLRDSDVTNEKESNKTGMISNNKKTSFPMRRDAEDNSDVHKVTYDVTQGIKDRNNDPVGPSVGKAGLNGVPSLKMEALPKGKHHSSSGGRKKSKKSHNDGRLTAELPNLPSRMSSSPAQSESTVLRIKFPSNPSKSRKDDMKSQRESRNLKDTFGEMRSEKDFMKKDKIMDPKNSTHGHSTGGTHPSTGKFKEKAGGKGTKYPYNVEPNLKADKSNGNPSTEIASTSGALQTHNSSASEADNWVQCDKCHKWRLLPNGLLPDRLPKKWICRMLTWLPGMNKCSFSEDDTTNALLVQYQLPAVAEKQNIQPDRSKGGVSMTASVGLQHGVSPSQLNNLDSAPNGGKNGLVQLPQNYTENDHQHSAEFGNPKNLSQSSVDLNSAQINVDAKPFKKEKKREADGDASGVPKKVKRVLQQFTKEQSPAALVSRGSRDGQNRSTSSSEVSKGVVAGSSSTSVKKIKDNGRESINTVQLEVNDVSGKKRKLANERYTEFSDWKEQSSRDNQAVDYWAQGIEANRGSENMGERNKKRSKGTDLQEKERFTSMADTRDTCAGRKEAANEDMPVVQHHGSNISHKSLEGRKSSKRDPELGLPAAATSNSSKLSAPCKVKVKNHKMKSSPAVKRLNSEHHGEKIRSVKSGGARNSFTNHDHNDEDLFSKSVGEAFKQISSVNHQTEHRTEKQKELEIGKDAHRKPESPFVEDRINASHQNLAPRDPGKRSVNHLDRVKLKNVAPSGSGRENPTRLSQCVSASEKGDGHVTTPVDSCEAKFTKQPGDGDVRDCDGGLTLGVRHHMEDGNLAEDIEASSSLRKDSSQNPAHLLKEAKELKHTADRLKKILSTTTRETAEVVFQAALKFLIGASLVEPVRAEIARSAGMISPSEVYKTTADLCEYWAREFERCNDMALAALAYKCMEVACMRVVYCNDAAANRDQHELQTALRSVPQVDSPSSSASDVDNLNHQAVIGSVKDLHLTAVHGNHVMSAGAMPNLVRLLNFVCPVNSLLFALHFLYCFFFFLLLLYTSVYFCFLLIPNLLIRLGRCVVNSRHPAHKNCRISSARIIWIRVADPTQMRSDRVVDLA
ncbi:hypothetical protein Dimus_021708 [Dionaea muscipula]